MRKLQIAIFLIVVTLACEKDPSSSMDIYLKNSVGDTISVFLNPKSEYCEGADMYQPNYRLSDNYSGPWIYRNFSLPPGKRKAIFYSENIDQTPIVMINKVFNSIQISIQDELQTTIEFSSDTAIGYCENIFDNTAVWSYEVFQYGEENLFSADNYITHEYTFVISSDKIR